MGIHVHLDKFEGPLALLLHLIRKEEMDIFDININQITKQYLEYIKLMKEFDLEVAGEFIAMASTLIQIKSRMLLPQYNDEGEVVTDDDPRKELVQKLLEYEKFKEASVKLYERPLVGRDIWLRGRRENLKMAKEEEEISVAENALFALIKEYRNVIRTAKKKIHKVTLGLQSIAERILEIKHKLKVNELVGFKSLLDSESRSKHSYTADKYGTVVQQSLSDQVLITFLTLLELAKVGFVSLFQNENFSEIHVKAKKQVDRNILERVEDYHGDASAFDQPDETEILFDAASESSLESNNEEVLEDEMASDEEIEAEEQRLANADHNQQQLADLKTDIEMIESLSEKA